jgi:hypothetical protein
VVQNNENNVYKHGPRYASVTNEPFMGDPGNSRIKTSVTKVTCAMDTLKEIGVQSGRCE